MFEIEIAQRAAKVTKGWIHLSKQVTSPVSAEIEEGFAKNTFLKFHVQNNC